MCELFGVSAKGKIQVNSLLKEFFSHSVRHPHGWGLAVFYENAVSLEKEPVQASESAYLKERLRHKIEVRTMIAHIRMATKGTPEYENCHPFVKRDNFDRTWTLAHNGTIFQYPVLDPYVYTQEGRTDSERIFCYFIDKINERQEELGRPLDQAERFELLDGLICEMSKGNKLNLLIYDGELMYVHCNYADTLYVCQIGEAALFATVPLDHNRWKPLPFTTLCAYEKGRKKFEGTNHGNEYKDNEENTRLLFLDFSEL